MKFIYYLRVIFISFEFLTLLAFVIAYLFFKEIIDSFIGSLNKDTDALKWLMLYPSLIAGWILKDGVGVLFPDDKTNKILHAWKNYWMLKAHFNIGIFYALFLAIFCISLWVTKMLTMPMGVYMFFACSIALSISAFSFYNAKIKLKELLINAS